MSNSLSVVSKQSNEERLHLETHRGSEQQYIGETGHSASRRQVLRLVRPGFQRLCDFIWVTAQVQNSPHHNYRFLFKLVIDGVWKSLGQHPMIAEKLRMDCTI